MNTDNDRTKLLSLAENHGPMGDETTCGMAWGNGFPQWYCILEPGHREPHKAAHGGPRWLTV